MDREDRERELLVETMMIMERKKHLHSTQHPAESELARLVAALELEQAQPEQIRSLLLRLIQVSE